MRVFTAWTQHTTGLCVIGEVFLVSCVSSSPPAPHEIDRKIVPEKQRGAAVSVELAVSFRPSCSQCIQFPVVHPTVHMVFVHGS